MYWGNRRRPYTTGVGLSGEGETTLLWRRGRVSAVRLRREPFSRNLSLVNVFPVWPGKRRLDKTERIVRASRNLRATSCAVFLVLASACSDSDRLTEPLPEPTELPEPLWAEEISERGLGAWRKYYMAHTEYEASLAMRATADVLTGNCCWVRFENQEPRTPFNNDPLSTNSGITVRPW